MDVKAYRAELIKKLAAVDEVIAGMIGTYAPKTAKALKAIIPTEGKRKRKRMSKAARAKISAAQKKRWAKQKTAK